MYLTSIADVTTNPAWLNGIQTDLNGGTGDKKTCAIVVVDKGNGVVDAFFFYFWAFNWGGVVLGNQLGASLLGKQCGSGMFETDMHQVTTWATGTEAPHWIDQAKWKAKGTQHGPLQGRRTDRNLVLTARQRLSV